MNGTQDTPSNIQAEPGAQTAQQAPAPAPGVGPGTWPAAPARAQDARTKSPALACILSAMPGLGQIYVGYYQRGFVHAIVVATLITILASPPHGAYSLIPLFSLFLAFFWLYNIIDAGRRATLYNQALAGAEDIAPPADLKMPGMRGSFLGGLLLIVVGAILLSNTRFNVPLDWVEEWWPLVPLGFGVYLLGKAIHERMGQTREE